LIISIFVCNFATIIQIYIQTLYKMAAPKLTIKIYPEKRNDKAGKLITSNVPIYFYISLNGKRLPYFSGYRCDIELVNDKAGNETMKQWNADLQRMKKNQVNKSGETSSYINGRLSILEGKINKVLEDDSKADLSAIKIELDKLQGKAIKVQKTEENGFFDEFTKYVDSSDFSHKRNEQLTGTSKKVKAFFPDATFDTFDDVKLENFRTYLKKTLGETTVNSELRRLRAFFNYAVKKGLTKNYPFDKITLSQDVYSAPVYLTIDERNHLYNFDPKIDRLRLVRDMFVLHCFIGTRVNDFIRLKKEHVKNGSIEYYENKKLKQQGKLIRVPLSETAKAILLKYDKQDDDRLFPFISEQKYNEYLKELFVLAKLNRNVTVLDHHTKKETTKPLNELVSSHMARKTFIGNLYKKTKDSVICSMTGHVQGSKAFSRYYNVEDEQKNEAINLIE